MPTYYFNLFESLTFAEDNINYLVLETKALNTVDDYLDGDQINGFDQINGQKGYDDYLYVVNSGFLTNYLTDLTLKAFLFDFAAKKIKIRKQTKIRKYSSSNRRNK